MNSKFSREVLALLAKHSVKQADIARDLGLHRNTLSHRLRVGSFRDDDLFELIKVLKKRVGVEATDLLFRLSTDNRNSIHDVTQKHLLQ